MYIQVYNIYYRPEIMPIYLFIYFLTSVFDQLSVSQCPQKKLLGSKSISFLFISRTRPSFWTSKVAFFLQSDICTHFLLKHLTSFSSQRINTPPLSPLSVHFAFSEQNSPGADSGRDVCGQDQPDPLAGHRHRQPVREDQ